MVNYRIALISLVVCVGFQQGASTPFGAPASCCDTMQPDHNVSAQTTPPPYTVDWFYMHGDHFGVNINSTDGTPFRGFFVQARVVGDDTVAYGRFNHVDYDDQQALDCLGGTETGLTHTLNDDKTQFVGHWYEDPTGVPANMRFVVTVVQTRDVYWMGLESAIVIPYPRS